MMVISLITHDLLKLSVEVKIWYGQRKNVIDTDLIE